MEYDVVVVLAGGIQDDGFLPENVKRRVEKAATFIQSGASSRLLMAGKWNRSRELFDKPPLTEAMAMKRYAKQLGIAENKICIEEKSHTTSENAQYLLSDFLVPRNWRKVLVVTSDFHLRRAKYVFDKVIRPKYKLTYVSCTSIFRLRYWIEWKIKDLMLSVAMVFAKLSRLLK